MRVTGAFAAVVLTLLGQAVAAAPQATLRLVDDTAPALLRGAGFQPREHVRVVIVAGTTRTVRKVVATRLGRFTVPLQDDANACVGFAARATGNKGSRATFKRAPGQCPVP